MTVAERKIEVVRCETPDHYALHRTYEDGGKSVWVLTGQEAKLLIGNLIEALYPEDN